MTLSLILACCWVIAAAVVAFLPMRYQYAPGLALLIAAVPLLVFLAAENNPWIVLAVLAAIISMFRRPLGALLRFLKRRYL
ncbi:DUF2484 family protein [Actibacterium sp.]|uniref:DUF2484 family protein n=1 Tax=Actibacterium sp. TaxID=1872125 RepID=UPI00356ACD04